MHFDAAFLSLTSAKYKFWFSAKQLFTLYTEGKNKPYVVHVQTALLMRWQKHSIQTEKLLILQLGRILPRSLQGFGTWRYHIVLISQRLTACILNTENNIKTNSEP